MLSLEDQESVSAAEAARRVGMTLVGAKKALWHLVGTGAVSQIGGGKTKLYRLNKEHSLARAAQKLFEQEKTITGL